MAATKRATDGSTTVKGYFNELTDQYTQGVVNTNLPSTDRALGQLVRHLVAEFEQLWRQIDTIGTFSANDELDDYSTTALEMLWIPFVVADLYQRAQTGAPAASAYPTSGGLAAATSGGNGGAGGRMTDHGRHGTGMGVAATTVSMSEATMEQGIKSAQEESLATFSRQDCLARSHEWFARYFEWMEHVGIADEKMIETYSVYRPEQRSQRIELSRTRAELEKKWREAEDKVQYFRAKRRRMQELMAESGEALEEGGGEEEEILRTRALIRLRWSFYDACHQMQLSARELEMLRAVSPDQRAQISAEYQRTLDAVHRGELSLGKHTYTILPGGMMVAGTVNSPVPLDADAIARGGGLTPEAITAMASQQMYRQQVRDELQVDRNPPTMSLEAFAQKEMAEVQRQTMEAQRMQRNRAEEDARLGPDGVEDRQRKEAAAFDDWKEEHPAYGPTNKGNYS